MLDLHIPKFVGFILHRLKAAGHEAYIVGGAVRDACLKRSITDWDVATSATSGKIREIFRDVRQFALKHETVTLVNSGRHFEVTPFRENGRSLTDDLSYRDFTIDAMAYDPKNGAIIDPFGGKTDLARRLIRAVEDPAVRFHEDPLRLMRSVRLATELDFRIEDTTLKSVTRMAHLLPSMAAERIREELMKVLESRKPSRGFNLMVRTGLIRHVIPELMEGYRRSQNSYHRYTIFKHIMETVDNVDPAPHLRLTALLHDIAKPRVRKKIDGEWRFHGHEEASEQLAREIMSRLRFGRRITDRVANLIRHHMIGYSHEWSDGAVRRLIRRVGADHVMDLILFRRADLMAHGRGQGAMKTLQELEARVKTQLESPPGVFSTRDLAIDGHAVMKYLGLSPGPEVGRVLRELMEAVTDRPGLNTKEGLEALLGQWMRQKHHEKTYSP